MMVVAMMMCLLHKFLKLFVNRHIFFQITRISRKDFFAIIIIIITIIIVN